MKTKNLISKLLFTLLVSLTFLISSCSKNNSSDFTIAFYKLKSPVSKGLENSIQEFYKNDSKKIDFKYIDDEKELKSLINSKKVQLVFTTDGINQKNCINCANKKTNIPADINAQLTSSLNQKIITTENKLNAAPILSDHYEIDISIFDYQVSNMKGINSWNNIEEFLSIQNQKNKTPLYFAGADSIDFFDMLGAFCEAIDGKEYYEQSLEILDKGGNPKDVAEKLIGNSTSPMVKTATLLKNYFRKGFISPDSFNFSTKEVERYAEENYAKMIIMPLSEHRTFDYDTIRKYSSIYFPSELPAIYRSFTANTIYAVPVNNHSEVTALLNKLYLDENQTLLSRNTGLAPVVRNCSAPDKQADDVRYWVAATNAPYAGLGHSTKASEKDLDKIKDCIKTILVFE